MHVRVAVTFITLLFDAAMCFDLLKCFATTLDGAQHKCRFPFEYAGRERHVCVSMDRFNREDVYCAIEVSTVPYYVPVNTNTLRCF